MFIIYPVRLFFFNLSVVLAPVPDDLLWCPNCSGRIEIEGVVKTEPNNDLLFPYCLAFGYF